MSLTVRIADMSKSRSLVLAFLLSILLHLGVLTLPSSWSGKSLEPFSSSRFLEVDFRNWPTKSSEITSNSDWVREKKNSISKLDLERNNKPASVAASEKKEGVQRSLDDYLPPSRLHRLPVLISPFDAEVDFLGREGVVGDAQIMLLISSSGDVDDVLIIESTLPTYVVDDMVSRFRASRFEPGVVGSMTVRSRIRIHISPPTRDEMLGNPMSQKQKAWMGIRNPSEH